MDEYAGAIEAGFQLGLKIAERHHAAPARVIPKTEAINRLVRDVAEGRAGSTTDQLVAKSLMRARAAVAVCDDPGAE